MSKMRKENKEIKFMCGGFSDYQFIWRTNDQLGKKYVASKKKTDFKLLTVGNKQDKVKVSRPENLDLVEVINHREDGSFFRKTREAVKLFEEVL